ncbi:thrombospondin type-1 domain-containing protein 7B-like [Centruroides vittatus]|uniref:thrombospondin type-1 domain-containing protein 7B-like n=1 Tax=Centruroides vittatus TaxID=120091 RepID=UPI00351094EC
MTLRIKFLLVAFVLLHQVQNVELKNVSEHFREYLWTTGPWEECYSETNCGYGERKRNVWCVEVNGYQSLERKCDNDKKPVERELCFKVCQKYKNSVRWKIGKWSDCLSSNSSRYCEEGPGRKTRKVVCIHKSRHEGKYVGTLPDEVCSSFYIKPVVEKRCITRCPQNCVVSAFGEWSECKVCGSVNRTRIRTVLVAPEEGGRFCPPLIQSEPCEHRRECLKQVGSDREYSLKLGRWSSCLSKTSENRNSSSNVPRVGFRTRNVSCIDGFGQDVHLSWCENHFPLRIPLIESCIIPRDCRVSEWSQWTTVGEGCITSDGHVYPEHRRRRRRIEKLPEGEGAPCPPLVERKSVRDGLASCDSEFKWVRSAWSRCIPEGKTCGGGLQTRIVLCMRNKDLIPVEARNCKEIRPPSMQQCNVECAKKCTVSEWSLWSTCLPVNVRDPLKSTTGYRKRTREILRKPSGIHECPWLVEVKSCREPEVVRWVTGNWSSCRLHDVTQPCGQGVMKREAICINPKGKHVSSSLCQMHVLPPKLLAPCYVPCPRDCVLAEWTEWSSCKAECNSEEKEEVRTRRRRVIAEHGSGGKPCPAKDTLTESEACDYEICSGYHWIKSNWSSCQKPKNGTCGKSVQVRSVQCVTALHQTVPDDRCSPEPKPMNLRSCDYPCPVDCAVTNFTEWTPCSDDCLSVQRRERFVLQSSAHGGRSCPSTLEETRKCNVGKECLPNLNSYSPSSFFWNVSTWSNCILAENLHCGKGFRVRKISCVKENGVEVPIRNCVALDEESVPKSSDPCFVFCNASCIATEWTSWSAEEVKGCPSVLKRTRERLGKSCDWIRLEETKPFPLAEVLATPEGHWSDCIVDDDSLSFKRNKNESIGECGVGKRYIRGNKIESCEQKGQEQFGIRHVFSGMCRFMSNVGMDGVERLQRFMWSWI